MHRTIRAVRDHARKLRADLSDRKWYNGVEVAYVLGVTTRTVYGWIRVGRLQATEHFDTTKDGSAREWHIEPRDIVDFVRRCPMELQGKPVDMMILVDLLVGLKQPSNKNTKGDTK